MTYYLLDTHSLLWVIFDASRLSGQVRSILLNGENTIYVSSVSFWEISLKFGLGKLELETYTPEQLPALAKQMGFLTLPIEPEEAARFYRLPKIAHKDPFDRMLIWQAISRNLILLSKDKQFEHYSQYGLKVLW
jgi:PIN domain nuclease of toxin-antitoxin system